MITTSRILLAFATVALSTCALRAQGAAASAPRSPDGQPVPAAVLEWRFEAGAGPADVRITFEFANERGRCDPALAAADSALAPQWYRYDRATASARVAVCLPPTYKKQVSYDWDDRST